jgi:hypothetical protein
MVAITPSISKSEREDLQRLLRQREKVLKLAAKQRSAELIADFENQIGQRFAFNQDEVWERAEQIAQAAVNKAQAQVAARCRELVIPDRFAPSLSLEWYRAKTMEAGCTEEEAMTAVTKAHAMMDAYAVTDAELNLTKEEKAILRREPPGTKDPHRIKWFLVNAVGDFCNCKGWRLRRDRGGGIVFCGLPSDAQFASWLLDTLAAFVQAEIFKFLIEAQPSNEDRRDAIRSFVLGCTDRICQRLRELCEQSAAHANSNARALVVIKDAAVQAKLDELNIHFRNVSCDGPGDQASYRAGKAAGNHASFGRPAAAAMKAHARP